MAISEEKMRIVIDNYFKTECDVNTSIRQAFEKGFRIGVKKGLSAQPEQKKGKWIMTQATDDNVIAYYSCSVCGAVECHTPIVEVPFCWHCGAYMRGGQDETD